jgi:Na+/melibiose symporter-like transporter
MSPIVQQTGRALPGIRLTASIFPAITAGVVLLFFYSISRTMEFTLPDELNERRKRFKNA